MRCPACGVEAVEQAVYCHQCGERLGPGRDELPRDSGPAEQPTLGPADSFKQTVSLRREAQEPPEEELWRGGYSSKAMIGAWVISGLLTIVLLIVGILAGC